MNKKSFKRWLDRAGEAPMFKTIQDVWDAIDRGETVYWSNNSYKVFVEPDTAPDITKTYEPRRVIERNGSLLCVRCISNYFGSILHESELGSLFVLKGENQ